MELKIRIRAVSPRAWDAFNASLYEDEDGVVRPYLRYAITQSQNYGRVMWGFRDFVPLSHLVVKRV